MRDIILSPEIQPLLIDATEAAQRLGISEHELKALVDAGTIPAVWFGGQAARFLAATIETLQGQPIDIPPVKWRKPAAPRESIEKPFSRVHRARKNYAGSHDGWRKRVFERDEYRCRRCGCDDRRVLTTHHIKHRNRNPELALDTENGITLCENCHKIEHVINPVRKRKPAWRSKVARDNVSR